MNDPLPSTEVDGKTDETPIRPFKKRYAIL